VADRLAGHVQRSQLPTYLFPGGALLGLVGAVLALAATAGVLPRAGVLHVVGLLLLPAALVLGAASVRLGGAAARSDALLVLGGFWLHLFALAVGVVTAGWWLAGGGAVLARAAVAWGIAAAAYALLGYGWDRITDTDVDSVLADWRG